MRLPAEWEPQSGVVIAWPDAETDWAERLEAVEASYIALASAIARFEPVLILHRNAALRAHAEGLLKAVDPARLHWLEADYDDTWLRDSGPITLTANELPPTLLDFAFTAWGGKFESARDDRLVSALSQSGLFHPHRHERIEFALEGGAIESDGAGTILSTWRCLGERHPDRSAADITASLTRALKAERVLWLDHGYLEGDDTDAHIDTLARLVAPDAIVYQGCDDPSDSHFEELDKMARELAQLRTMDGKPYRLFALPWPRPIVDEGRRLSASYANFLIVNGAVIVPQYDDPADQRALEVLGVALSDRQIVGVPARAIIWQNGSLHCLTMQLPEGVLQ
jgi:agmatine/peptidylarginine deiminase